MCHLILSYTDFHCFSFFWISYFSHIFLLAYVNVVSTFSPHLCFVLTCIYGCSLLLFMTIFFLFFFLALSAYNLFNVLCIAFLYFFLFSFLNDLFSIFYNQLYFKFLYFFRLYSCVVYRNVHHNFSSYFISFLLLLVPFFLLFSLCYIVHLCYCNVMQ